MKKLPVTILVLLALGAIIMSCTTTPIEQQFPERWEKTKIGMSLNEFKQVWPEARFNGYSDQKQTAEIWFVLDKAQMGGAFEIEYFTFENGKLQKFVGTGSADSL